MSTVKESKKIGLFGGTFDPIHHAHIQLAIQAQEQCDLDEVWILIDKNPRSKSTSTSYLHRLAMAKIASEKHSQLKVDQLSMQREGRTHDINSLRELQVSFPNYRFSLILGLDAVLHLTSWNNVEEFCNRVEFVVAVRPGSSLRKLGRLKNSLNDSGINFNYRILDYPPHDVSSSKIRLSLQKTRISEYIDNTVLDYIKNNDLYL